MLLLGDLLRLHVGSEAEKFLKPWWDVVIDYLNLVLVMVAVVTGVVGLYAPGPVCIPVLRCPAHNTSSLKTAECAKIRNSSESGENITAAVPFSDRNMFDYINSECTERIYFLVTFFPNVLIVAAGCCVVCSAAWFALKSHVLEEFSNLVKQCYKHADSENSSTKTTVNVKQHKGSDRPSAFEEDSERVKRKSQKFVNDFDENDTGNCTCCCLCFGYCWKKSEHANSGKINTEPGFNQLGPTTSDERTALLNTNPQHHNNTIDVGNSVRNVVTNITPQQHDKKVGKGVKNSEINTTPHSSGATASDDIKKVGKRHSDCRNVCTTRGSYAIVSVIQVLVSFTAFGIVLWLRIDKMNRQYECNINESLRIPGLVCDHFSCSHIIIRFYSVSAILFLVFSFFHMLFSLFKFAVSVVMLKCFWLLKADFESEKGNDGINSPDVQFLLKLLKFSNPAYVKPFRDMYETSDARSKESQEDDADTSGVVNGYV